MRHIDLFSGIGGFALASSWVWGEEYENVAHSDIEAYACKVYHRHFPESECLGDITKVDWTEERFRNIDIVTGGFPCQPHSVAGKRKGSEDERDLWGEVVRCLRVVRPRYFVGENVPGIFTSDGGRFFGRVLSDLASLRLNVEWRTLGAWQVGGHHKRDRIWIVAYPQSINAGGEGGGVRETQRGQGRALHGEPCGTGGADDVAHPMRLGHKGNMGEAFGQGREEASDSEPCSGSTGGNAVLGAIEGEDVAHAGGKGCEGSELAGAFQETRTEAHDATGERGSIRHTPLIGCERERKTWNGRDGLADADSIPDWAGGNIGQPWPVTEFERPSGEDVADSLGSGVEGNGSGGVEVIDNGCGEVQTGGGGERNARRKREREVERVFLRVADGVSSPMDSTLPVADRVARLKGLGNSIVPQVAFVILSAVKNADRSNQ